MYMWCYAGLFLFLGNNGTPRYGWYHDRRCAAHDTNPTIQFVWSRQPYALLCVRGALELSLGRVSARVFLPCVEDPRGALCGLFDTTPMRAATTQVVQRVRIGEFFRSRCYFACTGVFGPWRKSTAFQVRDLVVRVIGGGRLGVDTMVLLAINSFRFALRILRTRLNSRKCPHKHSATRV